MDLLYHAHNFQESKASPRLREALTHLVEVCQELPYLFWPEKSDKLQGDAQLSAQKEKQLKGQESLQSLYNVWLRQGLQERGFEAECLVRDVRIGSDNQKSDFAKLLEDQLRVFIEVEFGYTASIERNFYKLQDAYNHGRSALGVIVCPVARLAKVTASGVATFETARDRLLSFHPKTVPVPLLVLGLDHGQTRRVDLSISKIPDAASLSGNNSKQVLWHVASELRAGVCVEDIGLPNVEQGRAIDRERKARTTVADGQECLWRN